MDLPVAAQASWSAVLLDQHGVVSRQQALSLGWTSGQIETHCRRGRWCRLHPGVYATFTGAVPWLAHLSAALLHAGTEAVASHRSAARLQRFLDRDPDVVELTVPWGHRVTARPGVIVRSCRHLDARRHPAWSVPQTSVEHTVLDLVDVSRTADDVIGWLTSACQRRLTTPARIRAALAQRSRLKHRRLVTEIVDEIREGVASPLESRYRRDVERAHGLPRARRGERVTVGGRHWYADVRYPEQQLRVELEGLRWHAGEDRWRDDARDNAAALHGDAVLRFGWRAVVGSPCVTAAQVAALLVMRGWRGSPHQCGARCRVGR